MVYVDEISHCYTENPDGVYTPVGTDFFDGKCKEFVEGYCVELNGDGTIKQIYPWKPSSELDAAQRAYERQKLAEYEAALANSIPISDLDAAYQEGVNSV